jgi:HPr kinase/phosphorylase
MEKLDIILQGSFLTIFGLGTLITGKEGIGKSELALGLLSRNHQLIADDAPLFSYQDEKILGENPLPEHFISVRGIGLINVLLMFGPTSVKKTCFLDLIIHLDDKPTHPNSHLMGEVSSKDILGCLIPCVTIPIIKPRNLEVLVEVIVKNHLLKNYKDLIPVNSLNDWLQQKMDSDHS